MKRSGKWSGIVILCLSMAGVTHLGRADEKKPPEQTTAQYLEQLQIKLQVAATTTTVEVNGGSPVTMVETVGVLVVIENNPFPPMPMSGGRPAPLQK